LLLKGKGGGMKNNKTRGEKALRANAPPRLFFAAERLLFFPGDKKEGSLTFL
jgi:hypothetical protein